VELQWDWKVHISFKGDNKKEKEGIERNSLFASLREGTSLFSFFLFEWILPSGKVFSLYSF
jgi:hypothetical protein